MTLLIFTCDMGHDPIAYPAAFGSTPCPACKLVERAETAEGRLDDAEAGEAQEKDRADELADDVKELQADVERLEAELKETQSKLEAAESKAVSP